MVEQSYKKKLENSLEYFFIDSDMDDPEEDSLQTRYLILKWMNTLTYINCSQLKVKNNINHKEEFYKYTSETNSYIEGDYQIRKTIKKKMLCAKDINVEILEIGRYMIQI